MFCYLLTHHQPQDQLEGFGREIPAGAMASLSGSTIDDVVTLDQLFQKLGDLLWRVLEIIVKGYGHFISPMLCAREQGAVLTVVAHQVEATHFRILVPQLANDSPAFVLATIVYKNDLPRGNS
jgi:hypothetical protein